MLRSVFFSRGVTLVELMITLAIVVIAFGLGVPAFSDWIQNAQLRTAGETTMAAIQLARAEALKLNESTRFQLMKNPDAACVLATPNQSENSYWVVSLQDPLGQCNATPKSAVERENRPVGDTDPYILRYMPRTQATSNVTYNATQTAIVFNGLGRITPAPAGTINIDFGNGVGGTCVSAGGTMRCLRVQITPAGQVRMCDPSITSSSDPRLCT
jgi:type IV fimbrial biogenesis protein FimT